MTNPLCYPDGTPCHVGDLVWFNEGLCVGRVADILTPERMRAERESDWSGGRALFINYGLGEQPWGAPYCHDESDLAPEGIGRLTSTEELALEQLFRQLSLHTGDVVWDSAQWNYVAWLEPLPLGEGEESGYDWVWNIAYAPQAELEPVQRFRFNRATRRFQSPEEPYTPQALHAERPNARSATTSKGETYCEGDLVWEHGRLGVTTTRIHRIIYPDDAEAVYLYEKATEPWVETSDLERDNGGCVQSLSSFEQECCGKLSPTEELAVDLLFHQLEQHRSYPLRATAILRCGLSISPAPALPGEPTPNWRYDRSRRRLSLFICSERDPMLGEFLCYRFKRRSGEFVQEQRH